MRFGQRGIDVYQSQGKNSSDKDESEKSQKNPSQGFVPTPFPPLKDDKSVPGTGGKASSPKSGSSSPTGGAGAPSKAPLSGPRKNVKVQKAAFQKVSNRQVFPEPLRGDEPKDSGKNPLERRNPISSVEERTTKLPEPSGPAAPDSPQGLLKVGTPQGLRKVAKFLLLMGKDDAARVMRHLTEEEVEAISQEISGIHRIHRGEAQAILREFGMIIDDITLPQGGLETARGFLKAAFGEQKGDEILYKAVPDSRPHSFDFLEEMEFGQIVTLLRHEPLAVTALVLVHLPPRKASQVIEAFPPEKQGQLINRMGRMQRVDKTVLERMEGVLRERVRKLGGLTDHEVDGRSALAGILRFMDPGTEQEILAHLEQSNPDMSAEIREKLFTLEDILDVADEDLQRVITPWSNRDLALFLKDKNYEMQQKVLGNLSARRRLLVEEESRMMGLVPRRDVMTLTRTLLTELRLREQRGELARRSDGDEYV